MTAPCYKRMRNGGREADFPERMEQRALETAQFIRWVFDIVVGSSLFCGLIWSGLDCVVGSGNIPRTQRLTTLPRPPQNATHRHEVATDIICLQEYFLEDAYRALFEAELGREYEFIVHPRPSKRDGCAVLVRRGMFSVRAVRCVFGFCFMFFKGFGQGAWD